MAGAARLIIICGLPGSGKTTLAQSLKRSLAAVVFSADEWMNHLEIDLWNAEARAKIEALQWSVAQNLLAMGATVVIEWGTWARAGRDALRIRARELGAAVELHYLTAPVDVLFERIRERGTENPPIEKRQMQQWADQFEEPDAGELARFDAPISCRADRGA